jgi:hypothetical protein
MLIIRYKRVVSRLPLFVEKNINAEAPLKFKGRLKVKNIKDTSIKVIPQFNHVLGQAHYTKNDSYALKKVLKVRI